MTPNPPTTPLTVRQHAEAIRRIADDKHNVSGQAYYAISEQVQAILDALDAAPTYATPGRLTPSRLVPDGAPAVGAGRVARQSEETHRD